MSDYSNDPYDQLEDEDVGTDAEDALPDDDKIKDGSNDLDPGDPYLSVDGEGEQSPFGGSASVPQGEDTGSAMYEVTGGDPTGSGKTIGDIVNEDEKALYDIPPEGSSVDGNDILTKAPSDLDSLDEPTDADLEKIELEELGKMMK